MPSALLDRHVYQVAIRTFVLAGSTEEAESLGREEIRRRLTLGEAVAEAELVTVSEEGDVD